MPRGSYWLTYEVAAFEAAARGCGGDAVRFLSLCREAGIKRTARVLYKRLMDKRVWQEPVPLDLSLGLHRIWTEADPNWRAKGH